MDYSVLLTRLAEQNADFQSTLEREFELELIDGKPLLSFEGIEVKGLPKQFVFDLDLYDIIIFVSKNAVKFGLPQLQALWPQWPESTTWLAVGPATASLLKNEDFKICSPELASSEGMLKMSELKNVENKKILIVRGVGGRETLKEGLLSQGAIVDYLEVYERNRVPYDFESNFKSDLTQFTLVYSGEALTHLKSIVGGSTSQYRLILPSSRLQSMAIDLGFDKVILAKSQEDGDMVSALKDGIAELGLAL